MGTTLTLPNGKEYTFAEATFSRDTVRVIELFEKLALAKKQGKLDDFVGVGDMMGSLYRVVVSCLVRGGHSEEEAHEALDSIPFGPSGSDVMDSVRKAIGLEV